MNWIATGGITLLVAGLTWIVARFFPPKSNSDSAGAWKERAQNEAAARETEAADRKRFDELAAARQRLAEAQLRDQSQRRIDSGDPSSRDRVWQRWHPGSGRPAAADGPFDRAATVRDTAAADAGTDPPGDPERDN